MDNHEFEIIDDFFNENDFIENIPSFSEVINSSDPQAGKIVWDAETGALYKDGKMI